MAVIFIRTLIIYLTLTVVMRFLGKRQIGEMQPFEFIVTLIVADLACVPMSDVSIPLVYGIVSIIALFIIHQIFFLFERRGNFFKKILSGKPSIVIDKDGVCLTELKKNNLGVDDLIESMRSQGYFSLDAVDYAIFEANGKLSALVRTNYENDNPSIPLLLVNEGRVDKSNAEKLKITDGELNEFLLNNDCSLKKTEILTVDGNGRVYFQKSNEKYKILYYKLKDGVAF